MIVAVAAEKGGTGKTTLATTSPSSVPQPVTGHCWLMDADRHGRSNLWALIRARLSLAATGAEVVHMECPHGGDGCHVPDGQKIALESPRCYRIARHFGSGSQSRGGILPGDSSLLALLHASRSSA